MPALEERHTPGPWEVHGVLIRDRERLPIADVYGREGDPTHCANANLIAAAPDLLAACEAAISRLEIEARNWDVGRDKILKSDAYHALQSAVAKATKGGKQP